MELILHLGAHRTGSTAMERTFAANVVRLRSGGVDLLRTFRLRSIPGFADAPDLMSEAKAASDATRMARQVWRQALQAARRDLVLISEENFLGTMAANFHAGAVYADASVRLAAYADFLAAPVRRIGLAIRSYAPWWLSSYGFMLRRRALAGFESRSEAIAALGDDRVRGWPDLVADVRAAFPSAEVCVWTAESAQVGATDAIAAWLALAENVAMAPGPGLTNLGLSPDRIPQIHALRTARPDIDRAALDAALAAAPPPAPYRPFPPGALARLEDRYARDIERIACMPGVNFWKARNCQAQWSGNSETGARQRSPTQGPIA